MQSVQNLNNKLRYGKSETVWDRISVSINH